MGKRPFIRPNAARAIRQYQEQQPGQGQAAVPRPGQRPNVYAPPHTVETPSHEMAVDQKARAADRAVIPPAQGRTEIYEYFTTQPGNTVLLYSAKRWTKVILTLTTAGPVDVGTKAELGPVGGGKGRPLVPFQDLEISLNENDRLYIIANATNRVGVTIEPFAWLEQIALLAAKGIEK